MLIENSGKINEDVHVHRWLFSTVDHRTSRRWDSEFKSLDFSKEAVINRHKNGDLYTKRVPKVKIHHV